MKRLLGLVVIVGLLASGCGIVGGGGGNTYKAKFSRAIQLFPAGKIRVIGVDVGQVTDIKNTGDSVEVTFTVSDDTKLPADVHAAIVPVSLLGERYIQLFPAYTGGPVLPPGTTIPLDRTGVPAEPDELLRSLQDYLGALDPATVTQFVDNVSTILKGQGAKLNTLIHHGAGVIQILADKRADLAQIIVEFDKLSSTLSTRQAALGRLIDVYNTVASTLVTNRAALEGTITGLSDAARELADLLIAHRDPLHTDIENLTRTGQTLSRNVTHLANTGHWAARLFHAAQRAVDYKNDWLRLNNQGQELGALIMMRLEERLTELCNDLGLPQCSVPSFWSAHVPSMFCFAAACPKVDGKGPVEQLTDVINQTPALLSALLNRAQHITCLDAPHTDRCLQRKTLLIKCARAQDPRGCLEKHALLLKCLKARNVADVKRCIEAHKNADIKKIVGDLLKSTIGDPGLVDGITGGGG